MKPVVEVTRVHRVKQCILESNDCHIYLFLSWLAVSGFIGWFRWSFCLCLSFYVVDRTCSAVICSMLTMYFYLRFLFHCFLCCIIHRCWWFWVVDFLLLCMIFVILLRFAGFYAWNLLLATPVALLLVCFLDVSP